jgi:hypothetical protein
VNIRKIRQVLEINANSLLDATTQLARLNALMRTLPNKDELLAESTVAIASGGLAKFLEQANLLGARLAAVAAERLKDQIEAKPSNVTLGDLTTRLSEIESRFADYLVGVRLFALNEQQSIYLNTGSDLLAQIVCDRFPSVVFEMEEAAKCAALGRSTASVFHCMRALEPPIRALATFLGAPDPTSPAEKNWGFVLGEIRTRLDSKYPKSKRLKGTDGHTVERIFATLDAIKNPWRNTTMHAEATYQPHEAAHILQCVNVFLTQIAAFIDETGAKVESEEAIVHRPEITDQMAAL